MDRPLWYTAILFIAYVLALSTGGWLALSNLGGMSSRPLLIVSGAGTGCVILMAGLLIRWLRNRTSATTSVHVAVIEGGMSTLQDLLEQSPELARATDEHGATPLHLSALLGRERMAKRLLDSGSDPGARERRFGFTPLHMVCCQTYKPVVAAIQPKLVQGLSELQPERSGCTLAGELMDAGADPNAQAGFSRTPLHMAAVGGRVGLVRILLERGGNVAMVDDLVFTPLHYAAFGGSREVSELIIDAGADPDATAEMDYNPLHTACEKGSTEVARVILDAGLDPNITTRQGRTALALANQHGHHDLQTIIREHGGKPHVRRTER